MSDDTKLPTVDGFRVVRLLGEGGMGKVYEAEQASPRRTVALKLLHEESVDPESIRRLELEADALARLTHRGVVPLLAQGRTGDGVPWLALERVDGEPLDAYVRARQPALRERVRLFEELCDAVAHAHQKGVVHRDLKPGNVLVVPPEDESASDVNVGHVRVLDFGLARFMHHAAPGEDERPDQDPTLPGRIVGTLAYMSPEQARGDAGAVDQRSDVYALGGLLYELLTGRRPLDIDGLWLGEAARRIVGDDPVPPHRVARVPRDLSRIAMKALDKEPSRRYGSAAHLRDDVVRWQDGLPIDAVGPSTLYTLRKLCARHKAATAAAAVALFALLLAGPTFAWTARRQAVELRAARDRARAVLAFQEDVLSAADPTHDGRDVRLSQVLARAGGQLDDGDIESPAAEAAVRTVLGRAWASIGDPAQARPQLERALTLTRAAHGDDDPRTRELEATLRRLDDDR